MLLKSASCPRATRRRPDRIAGAGVRFGADVLYPVSWQQRRTNRQHVSTSRSKLSTQDHWARVLRARVPGRPGAQHYHHDGRAALPRFHGGGRAARRAQLAVSVPTPNPPPVGAEPVRPDPVGLRRRAHPRHRRAPRRCIAMLLPDAASSSSPSPSPAAPPPTTGASIAAARARRDLVRRAQAVLDAHGVAADETFEVMRQRSVSRCSSIFDVARDIVERGDV